MELKIENITKKYKDKTVLRGISFAVSQGESVGIMGESGSGKSTLIKIIAGLSTFSGGEIYMDEMPYSEIIKKDMKQIYRNIQLVFQNAHGAVNPKFTVKDVMLEPLNIMYKSKLKHEEKLKIAKENLNLMKLAQVDFNQKACSLSGGQLQRVCIARALMLKPKLLILDEALSGLDPLVQDEILQMLCDLREKTNISYIFVAHDANICECICDRIFLIEKGEINNKFII